jgi:GNAT superfamily N-acetyltransferase
MMRFSAPVPINPQWEIKSFSCGDSGLDDWLKESAADAETRTVKSFVVLAERRVIAYYTLAAGSVVLPALDGTLPNPVPAMILARLAVDQTYQRQGLAASLLRDALLRCLQVRRVLDMRMILALAIGQQRGFLGRYGFQLIPDLPHASFLPIDTILQALVVGEGDRGSAASGVGTAPPPLPYSAAADSIAEGTATTGR